MTFKLGKLPVKHDDRTLLADKYFSAVSPPPASVNWQSNEALTFNLFRNGDLGDCTCATTGHCIQRWTFDETSAETTVSDDDIVIAYSAVSGYDPTTGANDNGANELDVLNYWKKTGIAGHKIAAFVKLDHTNLNQVKQALNLFGAVYLGIEFPESAMDQFNNGQPWDVVEGATIEGGHAISVGAYDGSTFEIVTWGKRQKMTEAFWNKYVDEAYAVLGDDWFNGGKDPQGLDLTTLQQDLANIGKNEPNVNPAPAPPTPSPEPTPTPDPVPVPPTPDPTPPVDNPTQEFVAQARVWLGHRHEAKINRDFAKKVQLWLESNPS